MSEHRVFPHGRPVERAPGLWQVQGSLPFPLPRNMTLFRLRSGGLLVYSAVALDEEGMRGLEALGPPELLVVPHPFHLMDAPFFKARYPALRVVACDDAKARLAGKLAVDAHPEDALPAAGVRFEIAPGMKYSEIVLDLDVPGGRALVFTDLFGTPLPGFMAKLLGAPGGVGVPRVVKLRQLSDRGAVRDYLARLGAASDLKLILVSHGEPLSSGCAEALRSAAAKV